MVFGFGTRNDISRQKRSVLLDKESSHTARSSSVTESAGSNEVSCTPSSDFERTDEITSQFLASCSSFDKSTKKKAKNIPAPRPRRKSNGSRKKKQGYGDINVDPLILQQRQFQQAAADPLASFNHVSFKELPLGEQRRNAVNSVTFSATRPVGVPPPPLHLPQSTVDSTFSSNLSIDEDLLEVSSACIVVTNRQENLLRDRETSVRSLDSRSNQSGSVATLPWRNKSLQKRTLADDFASFADASMEDSTVNTTPSRTTISTYGSSPSTNDAISKGLLEQYLVSVGMPKPESLAMAARFAQDRQEDIISRSAAPTSSFDNSNQQQRALETVLEDDKPIEGLTVVLAQTPSPLDTIAQTPPQRSLEDDFASFAGASMEDDLLSHPPPERTLGDDFASFAGVCLKDPTINATRRRSGPHESCPRTGASQEVEVTMVVQYLMSVGLNEHESFALATRFAQDHGSTRFSSSDYVSAGDSSSAGSSITETLSMHPQGSQQEQYLISVGMAIPESLELATPFAQDHYDIRSSASSDVSDANSSSVGLSIMQALSMEQQRSQKGLELEPIVEDDKLIEGTAVLLGPGTSPHSVHNEMLDSIAHDLLSDIENQQNGAPNQAISSEDVTGGDGREILSSKHQILIVSVAVLVGIVTSIWLAVLIRKFL